MTTVINANISATVNSTHSASCSPMYSGPSCGSSSSSNPSGIVS